MFPRVFKLYLECATKSGAALYRNWLLLVGSVVAYFLFALSLKLFSPLGGLAAGMAVGMVHLILLTLYYTWIRETVTSSKLNLSEMLRFDGQLFFNIVGVAFLLFIVTYPLQLVMQFSGNQSGSLLLNLLIVLVFNAMPETIYQHQIDGIPAFSRSAQFTKQYWIEWFLPLVIVITPWLINDPTSVLLVMAGTDLFLPVLVVVQSMIESLLRFNLMPESAGLITISVISIVLGNWFMLFRGFLFQELESSRRKLWSR